MGEGTAGTERPVNISRDLTPLIREGHFVVVEGVRFDPFDAMVLTGLWYMLDPEDRALLETRPAYELHQFAGELVAEYLETRPRGSA